MNCKFSPCKWTWPLASCGNCLEASDSDISQSLCKDTIRSTLILAYSPGVGYRILWQLLVDSWAGSQEILGHCGSFVTAIGSALHMVVVPGHTCWHCGFQGSPDIRGWYPLLIAPPLSPLCSLIQKQQEPGSLCLTRLWKCPAGCFVAKCWICLLPGREGIGRALGPSSEMYMQIRRGLAIHLSLIWYEMCTCGIETLWSPTELRVTTALRPPNNPVPWVSPECAMPQLHFVPKNSWKPSWREV